MTNFVGMTAGSAVLLLAAVLAGRRSCCPPTVRRSSPVVYLVAATVGLFLLVLYVVQRWTASATAYVFVLMPIVALIVGALIADEEITATTILGGAIVFAGVYLARLPGRNGERTRRPQGKRPVPGARSSSPPFRHSGGTRYAGADFAWIGFSASCCRIIRAAVPGESPSRSPSPTPLWNA